MEKNDNVLGNVDNTAPNGSGNVDRRNYAFGKMNFILIAVGMLVVILGFVLMSGGGSNDATFDADIFSARRVKVAPVVCFLGFVSIIYAIIRKPKDN